MQAVRISPAADPQAPYSAANPASSSALNVDRIPVPQPKPGEALVRVHAATVTRDELTWPESYRGPQQTLGYDFAGVLESVNGESDLKPGDEVYGMTSTHRGGAWAEYMIVDITDLAAKPPRLAWPEAATVPMSALTAWQALFVQAGVPEPDLDAARRSVQKRVLITGSSGAVGAYLVQFAAVAGLHVVAASGSTARNGEFLQSLGATEAVEYGQLASQDPFDYIIDTVGGETLAQAWSLVAADRGVLVSVDSSSFAFAQKPPAGKEHVKATFFIVDPSGSQLTKIAKAIELGLVKTFVAYTFALPEVRQAYKKANGRLDRRGKVVLKL
ncbi:chaperonin 10-like protein [Mariannaea sp. PMI_226]|nr:chaperonin 10-like protein [Mariannaea sp. PMI_226]